MELTIPDKYFADEEREGFLVTAMMKRNWAAEMRLLTMVAEIFERNGLRWWADFGTMLGAVRHRGFVPWDDDIDISMPRADYEKGVTLLKKELPSYCTINKIDIDLPAPWTVIWSRQSIDYGDSAEEAEITRHFFGFPYICNLDIHPLDHIPADDKEQDYFFKLLQVIDGTAYYYHDYEQAGTLEEWLTQIEIGSRRKLHRGEGCRMELYQLFDELSQTCRRQDSCGVALLDEWLTRNKPIRSLSIYRNTIWLPFEMIRIPIPAGYARLLELEFRNWCAPRRGATHDYPHYGKQAEQLRQHQLDAVLPEADELHRQGRIEEERKVLLDGLLRFPGRYEFYYRLAKTYLSQSLGHVYVYLTKSLAVCDVDEDREMIAGEVDKIRQILGLNQ